MTGSRPDTEVIFHAARDIPDPDRRREYVREACGGNETRIAQVEALLAAAGRPDSLLDRAAAGTPVATIDEPATASPGTVIGRYKLIEQIGEGGMGRVWMAQQTEPVKRLVAVKLIKAGMDSRQVIARFEAERQALALMDHPNIARVLDAGTTSAGRPYFVMDLVKGVPITRYCDEHHLTLRQRLELFMPVCQAIQHAHQKGIIHRDLKPSNVLVAPYDGKPVVKVIDFGVAKAAGQQLTDRTLVTGFGAIVGTLEYMSPEQAELNNHDIDTRSDIYALGVLLYELLAGGPPFSRKELEKAGLFEMLRVIREQEPSKPSTKLSTAEGLPTLAANRGTEPAKLSKLVRGELDWIVMKALEKDRNRRFETANGFAMDVQRYLAGEAVLAAPATTVYRLRKFINRHKKSVVAVGLVLLILLLGIAGTTWGLVQAVKERNAKDSALKRERQARADETKARQQAFAALRSMTADVVERKFGQGAVLTDDDKAFLRGVIAQYDAFAAIKGDDADSRALRAEGRFRVGKMRRKLGEHKEAEQDLTQALSIRKQLAAEFPSRPEFLQDLAKTHNNRGLLLYEIGRPKEAERDYDDAMRFYTQLTVAFPSRPEFRKELAINNLDRGLLRHETARLREAEQDYDQALSIQKQLAAEFPARPEFRQDLAMSYNNRGFLLRDMGRQREAEQDYDQALRVKKQLVDDFPARPEFRQELAITHLDRGILRFDMGRLKETEQDYDETVRIYKQLAADFPTRPEFRQMLAKGHNNRGSLHYDMGRPKEAEQDLDQAISIDERLVTEFPSRAAFRRDLANSHNNRGTGLTRAGRFEEGEHEFDQAMSLRQQLVADSPSDPSLRNELASTYTNLALLHRQRGNWAVAKRLLLEGRPHHLAALKANPRHPDYRRFYSLHLALLSVVYAALLEQGDAVHTAEIYRDLGWDPSTDTYNSACLLSVCIPIVAKHDKLDDKQRQEAAQFYGDAAMKLLREAVSKGWKNMAHMKKDTDLDALRQRDDFRKLIAEMEAAEAPKKQ